MDKKNRKKRFIERPVYTGGMQAIRNFIRQHLVYPPGAVAAGIEGTVNLRYTIDHRGIVREAKIVSGLGYGCDEEAIRLLRLLRFEVPKKHHGLRVLFHKTISIHFRLPQQKPATAVQEMNVQYTITSSAPTREEQKEPEEGGGGYTYTISL